MSTGSASSPLDDTKCRPDQQNHDQQQVNLGDNIQNHLIDGDRNSSRSSASSSASSSPHQHQNQHHHPHQHRHQTDHQPEEAEQMRKLFIGGLDYKTSEATLKEHFELFGDVVDCWVMREPQTRRSRGFGFVLYANSQMVDRAQNARPHEVDGREVQSKRAVSREDSSRPELRETVKKAYIGGVSDDIEESDLREYFKAFGNVIDVTMGVNKDTGQRRGFAFVEFDDYDPVDKIVLRKFHTIKDKRIEAKKAIPKEQMEARGRPDMRSTGGPMMAMGGMHMEPPGARSRGPRNGGDPSLWDDGYSSSGGHYGVPSYPSQGGYGYPSHGYHHSPPGHFSNSGWTMGHGGGGGHGGGASMGHYGGGGGFRGNFGGGGGGGYGRNHYGPSQAGSGGGWSGAPQASGASEYGSFAPPPAGSGGPMRVNFQHRGWTPYGGGYGGGSHRGRGYN